MLTRPGNVVCARIDEILNKNNEFTAAVSYTKFNDLVIHFKDIEDLNRAKSVLKSIVREKTIAIRDKILIPRDIRKLKEKIFDRLKTETVAVAVFEDSVEASGLENMVESTEKIVEEFLADRNITSYFIELAPGEFDFVQNFRKADLKDLETENPNIDINLVYGPCRRGFSIRGQKVRVRKCIAKLNSICANISSMTLVADCLEDVFLNFVRNDNGKKALSDLQLQRSQQCVLKVTEPRFLKVMPVDYFQSTKRANCRISKFLVSLHVGCAACLKGDVLVNPSDINFEHYRGISAVIVERGKLSFCYHHLLS